jgi:hypothetical protein
MALPFLTIANTFSKQIIQGHSPGEKSLAHIYTDLMATEYHPCRVP